MLFSLPPVHLLSPKTGPLTAWVSDFVLVSPRRRVRDRFVPGAFSELVVLVCVAEGKTDEIQDSNQDTAFGTHYHHHTCRQQKSYATPAATTPRGYAVRAHHLISARITRRSPVCVCVSCVILDRYKISRPGWCRAADRVGTWRWEVVASCLGRIKGFCECDCVWLREERDVVVLLTINFKNVLLSVVC